MKIIVITGLIGSGKSTVSRILVKDGIPVYDCDSRAKMLYDRFPEMASLSSADIFDDPQRLSRLEAMLFPKLLEDFNEWSAGRSVVGFESATVLSKPFFDGFGDYVLWVDAPREERLRRALARGGISEESILSRMALQEDHSGNPRVSAIIDNSSDLSSTEKQVNNFINNNIMAQEKTDLGKILSVSGYPGLYSYVAQSRTGVIAANLSTGERVNLPANGKITTLEDIAIYTDEGEMKLREVFLALAKTLGEGQAPTAKDPDEKIRAVFSEAVPTYDADRFYLSHMKKVVTWYNLLKAYASLDFVDPEQEQKDGE